MFRRRLLQLALSPPLPRPALCLLLLTRLEPLLFGVIVLIPIKARGKSNIQSHPRVQRASRVARIECRDRRLMSDAVDD